MSSDTVILFGTLLMMVGYTLFLLDTQRKRIRDLEDMNNILVTKLRVVDASQKKDYPTARLMYETIRPQPDVDMDPSAGASDETLPPGGTDAPFIQIG